ncbi:1752_t:CDS:2 [Cetraspora pellucida]|uniref:1752_t:CDS:1 n=1 Tax=Cetraspora pellucida TaxID=1433469 RepID=A0A9N9ETC2_9GLOM|nr:1752_t:CDS:2 [Cetraspora pellucida]
MDRFLKIYLSCLLALVISVSLSLAAPSPTIPIGDTIWNSGDNVTAMWTDVGDPKTSTMSAIKVQFMTGPDDQQIPLVTLAENLTNTATSLNFIVPAPSFVGYYPGKIYFLMFSDPAKPGIGVSWSTRFTVLEAGNSNPPANYTPGTPWTFTKSPSTPATPAPVIAPTTVQQAQNPAMTTPPLAYAPQSSMMLQNPTYGDVGSLPTDSPGSSSNPSPTPKKSSGCDSKFLKSNGKFLVVVMSFICVFLAYGV